MAKNSTVKLLRPTEHQNKILFDTDNNPFLEEIDPILSMIFHFKNKNSADDFYIGEINVSSLFQNYQNQLLKLARDKSLLVKSNVHEILSLSILMLFLNHIQHS